MSFAEFELQIAALGNLQRGAQQLRMIGKEALHFGGGLEPGSPVVISGGATVVNKLPCGWRSRRGDADALRASGSARCWWRRGGCSFPAPAAPPPAISAITGREVLHGEVEAIAEDFLELCRT